jgi:hypothetical protein
MWTLRIEHRVANYDAWKRAFDSDPAGRERSAVRRYRVLRLVDDADYVMIDLDFDTSSQAEALLGAMRGVWAGPALTMVSEPQARIVEVVEAKEF